MVFDQVSITVDVETTDDFDTMIADIEDASDSVKDMDTKLNRITDHDPCPHCNRCPHCGRKRYFTPALGRNFY